MIPVLYSKTSTEFYGNGLGLLSDVESCECTEKLNDSYELLLKMRSNATHARDIDVDCIIKAKPNYEDDPQPFRIYSVEKDGDGEITVRAAHISYDTCGIPVLPFTAENLDDAVENLNTNRILLTDSKFVINSEFSAEGTMEVKAPTSFRSLLGGSSTSIIEIYKGEYHYDNFTINLMKRRGKNRGVCFRYGKNIAGFEQTLDSQKLYTAVLGYWKKSGSSNQNDNIIYGNIIQCEGIFSYDKIYILDTTNDVKTEGSADATVDQIDECVTKYIEENAPGIIDNKIKIDYTKDDDIIQICIGDVAGIIYPEYNINLSVRCNTVVFDCLEEKNISVEVGTEEKDIADIIVELSSKE